MQFRNVGEIRFKALFGVQHLLEVRALRRVAGLEA